MATLVLLSWLANNKVVANKTLVARQLVAMAEKLLAGAVQTEVNEVPPAPCYPSWPFLRLQLEIDQRAERSCAEPIIHTKRFNSTTLPISQQWSRKADGVLCLPYSTLTSVCFSII